MRVPNSLFLWFTRASNSEYRTCKRQKFHAISLINGKPDLTDYRKSLNGKKIIEHFFFLNKDILNINIFYLNNKTLTKQKYFFD